MVAPSSQGTGAFLYVVGLFQGRWGGAQVVVTMVVMVNVYREHGGSDLFFFGEGERVTEDIAIGGHKWRAGVYFFRR